jgi:hypothetical protein
MYVAKNREFFFPLDLIDMAESLGISRRKLADMIRRSTRITHPNGNRRFGDYLFQVDGDRVTAFGRVDELSPAHPRTDVPCPRCDGGLVRNSIPCPECSSSPRKRSECFVCEGSGQVIVFDECSYCAGTGKVV